MSSTKINLTAGDKSMSPLHWPANPLRSIMDNPFSILIFVEILPTLLIIVTVTGLCLILRQILLKIVFSLIVAWSVAATVGLKMWNINFALKFLFYTD